MRRSVYVEGFERAAARRFGLARETVRKMLRYLGMRQPARRPKLTPSRGSSVRSSARIRPGRRSNGTRPSGSAIAEYGFTGGDTIVKAYVRAQRLGGRNVRAPDPSAGRTTLAKRWW